MKAESTEVQRIKIWAKKIVPCGRKRKEKGEEGKVKKNHRQGYRVNGTLAGDIVVRLLGLKYKEGIYTTDTINTYIHCNMIFKFL